MLNSPPEPLLSLNDTPGKREPTSRRFRTPNFSSRSPLSTDMDIGTSSAASSRLRAVTTITSPVAPYASSTFCTGETVATAAWARDDEGGEIISPASTVEAPSATRTYRPLALRQLGRASGRERVGQ